MLEKRIGILNIIGIIFTAGIGTFLHFLFELSGENIIAGLFSAVNESTWEHLKLFFMPYLIFTFIEYLLYGKFLDNFFTAKLLGAFIGMGSTIILFYTCTGIIGKNIGWLNILIFFISVIAAYAFSYIMTVKEPMGTTPIWERLSLISFFIMAALFFVFTFYPPKIGLFRSAADGSFGIKK